MVAGAVSALACPICQSLRVEEFLRRRSVPVHQNIIIRDRAAALDIPKGDLELSVCRGCGFVFNKAYDKRLLSYGGQYDNNQASSPLFQDYLSKIIGYLISEKKLRGRRIVEIGCGNGLLLKRLCEQGDNSGLGFDPSYTGPCDFLGGRVHFVKKFFQEVEKTISADAVICRHVIEHEPEPMTLLGAVRRYTGDNIRGKVFFETPCVEWILKNGAFWDFFYEHCSYFSQSSLITAFQRSGFQVEKISRTFGDQYIWLEAGSSGGVDLEMNPGRVHVLAERFAGREKSLIGNWENRISGYRSAGPVALWGAGAKGVTFANLLDPRGSLISCVIDLNPNKQGGFIPGTGHPIVSVRDIPGYNIATAIIMNSNYTEECRKMLREAGIDIRLVEIETCP